MARHLESTSGPNRPSHVFSTNQESSPTVFTIITKIDLGPAGPLILPFAGVWLGDLSDWHVMQSGRRVTVVVFGVGKL